MNAQDKLRNSYACWLGGVCRAVPYLLGVVSRHPTWKHAVLWALSRFTMSASITGTASSK